MHLQALKKRTNSHAMLYKIRLRTLYKLFFPYLALYSDFLELALKRGIKQFNVASKLRGKE